MQGLKIKAGESSWDHAHRARSYFKVPAESSEEGLERKGNGLSVSSELSLFTLRIGRSKGSLSIAPASTSDAMGSFASLYTFLDLCFGTRNLGFRKIADL